MTNQQNSSKTDSPSKGTDCVPKGYKIASVPYQRDKEYRTARINYTCRYVGTLYNDTYHLGPHVFQTDIGGVTYVAASEVFEKVEPRTLWLNIYFDRDEGFYYSGVDCFSTEPAAEDDGYDHTEYVKTVKVEFYDAP